MAPDDAALEPGLPPPARVAFLLSQVGAAAAAQFGQRLSALELQPSDVGILRLIALNPQMSQQALAKQLSVVPSRVVVLIDALEKKGLVQRRRNVKDRRNHELHLTTQGREVMAQMRQIGSAHEEGFVGSLTAGERRTLHALLAKLAEIHHLTPGVHPGYQTPITNPADTNR